MVLWILLFVGLGLLFSAVAVTVSMIRAERRARRRLYRALGLADEAVDLLMERSGDILTELSLIRMSPGARDPIALPGLPTHEAPGALAIPDSALVRPAAQARAARPAEAAKTVSARRRRRTDRRRL